MFKNIPKDPAKLLKFLVTCHKKGSPLVCTYSFVARHVLGHKGWNRSLTQDVLKLSRTMPGEKLPGLETVYLDTFIVAIETGWPGEGHWNAVKYTKEDWGKILGNADVLH